MRHTAASALTVLTLTVSACHSTPTAQQTSAALQAQEIAWRHGDVEEALREAKATGKPVMLYWGAKWCPPCNAMKTTLFKDPSFIKQTESFIPVYLDGDAKGAQLWGERFHISGYPTVIIMSPDRTEVMRLSSAEAPRQLAAVLRTTATRKTSSDDLMKMAASDPGKLSREDWSLLASYGWWIDDRHFASPKDAVPTLRRLAAAAPSPKLKRQFDMTALALMAGPNGKVALTPADQALVATSVPAMLADEGDGPGNQVYRYVINTLIISLPPSPERTRLAGLLTAANDRTLANRSFAPGARASALYGNVTLAKELNGGKAPASFVNQTRRFADWVRSDVTDPMVLQAVVPWTAEAMEAAGDKAGAMRFLKAELPRALSPSYYYGLLAGMSDGTGAKAQMLDYARRAYETSDGPATRVERALDYSEAVLEDAPADKSMVELSASAVVDAVANGDGSMRVWSRKRLAKWNRDLTAWSRERNGAAVLTHVRDKLDEACRRQADPVKCKSALKV